MNQPPSYSPDRLKTLAVLQRNRMAWIMFWFLLAVFTVVLAALMYAVFSGKGQTWIRVALVLLDGIVGWSIKSIVSYLFPPICRGKKQAP